MRRVTVVRRLLVGLLAGAIAASAAPARACPFCTSQGATLTTEANQAGLIVFGTLANPKLDPNEFNQGTTDMTIEAVVKDHPFLTGKKTITLPRYVPPDVKPTKYLVFCEIFKDKLDPYRGLAVPTDSKIAEYLKGALAIKEKDAATKLKYFFQYLDAAESEVSADAYMEFGNSDYKDYRDMAAKLPPEKVVGWLKDPNTPPFRFGLYGSMLGHCGKAEHAAVLRDMLDDPKKRFSSGMDGILAGYVMLSPKEGWEYVRGQLKDPEKEYLVRYAGLRAVRFFWELRNDVIDRDEAAKAVALLLDQADICDLAIDDLRKWGRWEMSDRILGLAEQKSHNIPIIRRAILRYALCCPPENKKAAEFVKEQRAKDPERVKDVEELLKLESLPPVPSGPPEKK
jgi:hypothetical protein